MKEKQRLQALDSYEILYAIGNHYFDELVELASRHFKMPVAQINFIDEHNQWSLASWGLEGKTVSREHSFCNKTIQKEDSLIIENARRHPQFKDNMFVTGDANLQFYAGVNIKSKEGFNIGTICVIDHEPRKLTDQQFEDLEKFARQVECQLELRYKNKQVEQKNLYLNSTIDLLLQVNPFSFHIDEFIMNGNTYREEDLHLQDLLVDPSDMTPINDWVQSTGPDGFPLQMEKKLQVRDGTENWYAITGTFKYGYIYLTAQNVNQRKAYERDLKQAIADKNALLSEVHHRVKNNLAIVSGLLELEAENHRDESIWDVLAKCQLRIQSIAKIHETLYSTLQFSSLSIHDYLNEVLNAIVESFDKNGRINIELECDSICLDINQSIPMALILNELVVNAYQHAFEESQKGTIWIRLKEQEGNILLDVWDSGKGLPTTFDMNKSSTLGMTLIKNLVQQVHGTVNIENPSQSHFHIEFPIRAQKGAHSNQDWKR